MLPILLSLGPVKIYSYGVCLTIGLFIALYFWWKMGRDEHFDEIILFDGFFLSVLTYLVAGRLGYVLLHMDTVGTIYRTLAILAFPGINSVIGIIGVFVFIILFARAHNWNDWKVADSSVVSLSMVMILGGLGGFLNGSNPGREVSWGVMYPGETAARIPVDVWTMIWAIFTFAIVSRVRKNFRFYSWYKGESSIAQEGLAALVFAISVGVYYLVVGFIDSLNWKIGFVPGEMLVGIALISLSSYIIYKRIGRRDATVWGKLREIKINFMQWLRKRRS